MKEDFKLPEGWKWVKLGEVCQTTSGGTPSRKESKYYNGKIPWVKSGELDKGIITDTEEKISMEAVANSSAKIFPKGTLLIALYGATIGKLAFLGIEAATNQAICGIYENESIDSNLLYYYLFYKKSTLVNQGIGGAQPNISQTILKELKIPLPPTKSQKAIVSKIDELFSELDKGIENLRIAQKQLKIYRRAVLKWAFEGRLTNENVKEGELPEGWKWEILSSRAERITDGEHFRPKTQETGIPFLSAKDVREEGVSFKDSLFISEQTAEKALTRCNPTNGDILIVSRGATVGRMCVVKTNKRFCLLGSVILVKANRTINSRYLYYALKSPLVNQKIIAVSGATAQQAIYLRDIKNIKIPICVLKEQDNVTYAIEIRFSIVEKLEENIKENILRSEALRQTILKRAFEGKLI